MNKNGFTLVELLAAIVIMGILITLAVPSYITVSNNAKKRTYDNKITTIELAAEKYANDYNIVGSASISVMDLIKAGYYQADSVSQDGNTYKVSNPIDNSSMLCYIANIITEDGNYKASVVAGTTDASGTCVASTINESVVITAYQYDYTTKTKGAQISDGSKTELDWTNQDVILIATLNDPSLTPTEYTFSLGSNSQTKKSSESGSNQFVVHASYFLNSTVYVSIKTSDDKTKTNSIKVKIDKEKPTITITSDGSWSQGSKPVTLNGSDGSGSGVKAYFYTTDNDKAPVASDFTLLPNKETMYQTSLNTGIYYMYVIDVAGNISDKTSYVINEQDANGPQCLYSGEKTNWSTSAVTITFSCKDTGAGCKDNQTTTRTYNVAGTETATYAWNDVYMEDNLGNKTPCNKALNIYYDTKGPSCYVTSSGAKKNVASNFYTDNITIGINYSDDGSGVGGSLSTKGVSTTNSAVYTPATNYQTTDTNGTAWYGFAKDNLGNASSCTPLTVQKDTVAPALGIGFSRPTASYSCSDAGSGVISAGGALNLNGQASPYTYNVSCTDNAGNISYGNHTYNYYRASDCGIESYNSCATASCGVASYNYCQSSACGYKTCTSSGCCGTSTKTYYSGSIGSTGCYSKADACYAAHGSCNVDYYDTTIKCTITYSTTNTCTNSCCGTKSCWAAACGVESYNSCRTADCGVESYYACWHE